MDLDPFSFCGLNVSTVIFEPKIPEVIFETDPDVPVLRLGKETVVLIEVIRPHPGAGAVQHVLQAKGNLCPIVPEGLPKSCRQSGHGIKIIGSTDIIRNVDEGKISCKSTVFR